MTAKLAFTDVMKLDDIWIVNQTAATWQSQETFSVAPQTVYAFLTYDCIQPLI